MWKKLSQTKATSHLKKENQGNLTILAKKKHENYEELADKKTKSVKSSGYLKGVLEED